MKDWRRATVETICHGCVVPNGMRLIAVGEPILVLTLPGITRKSIRCARCAGEPVPADLPALEVTQKARAAKVSAPQPLTRFSPGMLPIDWKAQPSREPGEDG